MPEEEHYLTAEKKQAFEEELHLLKFTRRQEIADQLEYAKSLGDLSENAEYHQARADQATTEARISQLEHILKHAKIITHTKSDTVQVGSTVLLDKVGDKSESKTFTIVDSEESDMSRGNISFKSPLGAAVLGKKKSEEFSFMTPGGSKVTYILKKIS